ncbi:hypothetical protein PPE03_40290 [Pseudoalteromonas peptidolytica]|nr:hypothetical protein PPE03_40290 [Pseudoalteromonas peptidolytica]
MTCSIKFIYQQPSVIIILLERFCIFTKAIVLSVAQNLQATTNCPSREYSPLAVKPLKGDGAQI